MNPCNTRELVRSSGEPFWMSARTQPACCLRDMSETFDEWMHAGEKTS